GTDVASFGDPFHDSADAKTLAYEDQLRGVYQKLVVDGDRLVGGVLVGDTSDYGRLLHLVRTAKPIGDELPVLGRASGGARAELPDDEQICSCNNVSAGTIRACVRGETAGTVAQLKACTKAGSGCGGCLPLVADLLQAELARGGRAVKRVLCE